MFNTITSVMDDGLSFQIILLYVIKLMKHTKTSCVFSFIDQLFINIFFHNHTLQKWSRGCVPGCDFEEYGELWYKFWTRNHISISEFCVFYTGKTLICTINGNVSCALLYPISEVAHVIVLHLKKKTHFVSLFQTIYNQRVECKMYSSDQKSN